MATEINRGFGNNARRALAILPANFFATTADNISPGFVRTIKSNTLYRISMQPTIEEFEELKTSCLASDVVAREFLQRFDQRIIYEDPHLLVVNKPAGALSHRNNFGKFGIEEVVRQIRGVNMQLVHRLDINTSGALVFASDFDTHVRMSENFGNKERLGMKKIYVALLDGAFERDGEQKVAARIHPAQDYSMQVVPDGTIISDNPEVVDTLTYFEPLMLLETKTNPSKQKTLTSVRLITGKKHQIRVAAAQVLGMPVTGDSQYGSDRTSANRPMLHAFGLHFTHPQTGQPLTLEAPLTLDFVRTINSLTLVKNYKKNK